MIQLKKYIDDLLAKSIRIVVKLFFQGFIVMLCFGLKRVLKPWFLLYLDRSKFNRAHRTQQLIITFVGL